jgi:hypothetical protein
MSLAALELETGPTIPSRRGVCESLFLVIVGLLADLW